MTRLLAGAPCEGLLDIEQGGHMDDLSWAEDLPPTLAIEVAAKLLGISRSTAYAEAARYRHTDGRSGLPNFRMGSRVLVLAA